MLDPISISICLCEAPSYSVEPCFLLPAGHHLNDHCTNDGACGVLGRNLSCDVSVCWIAFERVRLCLKFRIEIDSAKSPVLSLIDACRTTTFHHVYSELNGVNDVIILGPARPPS